MSMATITPSRRSQRSTDRRKQVYTVLLGGAAMAVALSAALTAWAAQLGDGVWLPVLAPFVLVLTVPLAALVRLRGAEHVGGPTEAPGSSSATLRHASHATNTAIVSAQGNTHSVCGSTGRNARATTASIVTAKRTIQISLSWGASAAAIAVRRSV